jgi:hypothetical protein
MNILYSFEILAMIVVLGGIVFIIYDQNKKNNMRKILCRLGIHRWIGILPTRTNKQHRCIHCGKIKWS